MLRHKKQPTPQELYWARKRREEEERDANLPPGLINHGNTCFMNSTLQGVCVGHLFLARCLTMLSQLIATPLLHSLVNFEDSPSGSTTVAPYRSPALTNGHGVGAQYEQKWVQGMPLGDVFVVTMQRAWAVQESHKRESMSPRYVYSLVSIDYLRTYF